MKVSREKDVAHDKLVKAETSIKRLTAKVMMLEKGGKGKSRRLGMQRFQKMRASKGRKNGGKDQSGKNLNADSDSNDNDLDDYSYYRNRTQKAVTTLYIKGVKLALDSETEEDTI